MWADSTLWSVVGVAEALSRIPQALGLYWSIRQRLLRERPHLTVVIDAPAIHMRLAGVLQRYGLRCLYYFPPSAWSRNPKRLHQIHSRVSSVIAAFSFNAAQYRKAGLDVHYFGHPLVDLCQPLPRAQALSQLGLEEGTYAAMLPGSRTQEIRLLLPEFLNIARQTRENHPDLQWLLPSANPHIEALIREMLGEPPAWLRIVPGQARTVMNVSRAGLLSSGSATLEASLLDLPHLLCYKLNPFDYWLGSWLRRLGILKVHRFGLPNLLAEHDVVPEYLQEQIQVPKLARELEELLQEGPLRANALQGLAEVRSALGAPGAVAKIAECISQEARRGL